MILGIDPGLSGALALYCPVRKTVADCWDMPTYAITRGRQKRALDCVALSSNIERYSFWDKIDFAVMEEVHAMPMQGIVTTGQLMKAYGAVEGILAALRIPTKFVPPTVWKRAMRVTADKDSSRERASQLAPAAAKYWPNKGHHGRAEAFLIAVYASQSGQNK